MKSSKYGLSIELTLSLALLMAACVGLTGFMVFQVMSQGMLEQRVARGELVARALDTRLETNSDRRDLARLLGRLAQGAFEGYALVDASGRQLASSPAWTAQGEEAQAALSLAARQGQGRVWLTRRGGFLFFGPDPALNLALPLAAGGALGLYSGLEGLTPVWRRVRLLVGAYLALFGLLGSGYGYYISVRRLRGPVAVLAGRAAQLGKEGYQGRANLGLSGELGQLAEAFEDMATSLETGRLELAEKIETLEETRAGLIKAEKMASVGRMSAGLAHELGNPLASLTGFVHLLQKKGLETEKAQDFLSRMESELRRMDAIIRSLLDYARPVEALPRAVDAAQAVRRAVELVRVQKPMAQVRLETSLAQAPAVMAEPGRLTQVLVNLLMNAGQAMEGRGAATISTSPAPGGVFIRVADQGPGIAPEDQERVFDPFFTTKPAGQGAGLGLAVSRSIVESFGGWIRAETAEGGGALFTVFLPLAESGEA